MRFKILASGHCASQEWADKLTKLGFRFKKHDSSELVWKGYYRVDDNDTIYIDIDTLEELVDFIKRYGRVIFDGETIVIYDNNE